MHLEETIDVAAAPDRVWEIMTDVERWHEWTRSITSVQRLDGGAFGLGSHARVTQPRLRPAVFEVTAFEPGRSFAWRTRSSGLAAIGNHAVEPAPSGSRATLSLDFEGWLLALIGWWVWRISVRYLTMEAEGLKGRAEAGPTRTDPT